MFVLRDQPTRPRPIREALARYIRFCLAGNGAGSLSVLLAFFLGLPLAPLTAVAQQAENPVRIGFIPLGSSSNAFDQSLVEAFRQGLREAGLVENRHVIVDVVWVTNDSGYAAAVSELVERGARVLVPAGSSAAVAAKRHTSTIPIVFAPVGNPVGIGLVDSLSRPGHNVTGFSDVLADLSGKYVDLARDLGRPQGPIDYVWYSAWPDGQNRFQATERAASSLGVKLRARSIGAAAEIDDVMAAMKKAGAATIIVQPSPFTYRYRVRLIESAMAQGLGTILAWPQAAREGALIAYGPAYTDMYRRAASYVARIIRGAKPADLPVQEPTIFELGVNMKSAKTLGVTVPQALLNRADEVIR
jgi:putative ABC transport system substrate-binding protein